MAGRQASAAAQKAVAAGEVKLEFIGKQTGSIPYTAPSGTVYRGGRNPSNRFVIVSDPADLEWLLTKAPFRRVKVSAEPATEEVKAEPVVTSTELPVDESNTVVIETTETTTAEEPAKPSRQRSQQSSMNREE